MMRPSLHALNSFSLMIGLLALPMLSAASASADVSREEIASALAKSRKAIRSIFVRYEVRTESLETRPELIRTSVLARTREETTSGWMDDKIYFKSRKVAPSPLAVTRRLARRTRAFRKQNLG